MDVIVYLEDVQDRCDLCPYRGDGRRPCPNCYRYICGACVLRLPSGDAACPICSVLDDAHTVEM